MCNSYLKQQLAIIGSTASGKSSLAIKIANAYPSTILSLDSLSIYKEIDIASAKPTLQERGDIPHFGIDIISPDEKFNVMEFIKLYKEAYDFSLKENRILIIVGGSSFYLKTLIDGISPVPKIDINTKRSVEKLLSELPKAYQKLQDIDPIYASKIASNDRYRIEKALLIALSTNKTPTQYFRENPAVSPIKEKLPIYEIKRDKEELRERIVKRTDEMIQSGLIDEVAYLESKYTREPNSMKAIGIKEVLDYFDGILDYKQMREKISTNTARLAKRQNTFNKSQFKDITRGDIYTLEKSIKQLVNYPIAKDNWASCFTEP